MIWILTSLGASAKLLEKLHYCGIQEIEHTRRTLAMANAYSNSEKTFDALPAMMNEKMGLGSKPWVRLAEETFWDGCLIEDFNADVADEACKFVQDPAAAQMVKMIAQEERFHANVAWEILDLCLEKDEEAVKKVLRKAVTEIPAQGSFCYSKKTLDLVARSNQAALRQHGRVSQEQWQPLYEKRLVKIRERIEILLSNKNNSISKFESYSTEQVDLV